MIRIDSFMAMIGLGEASGEPTEEVLRTIRESAEAFLRAGGVLLLSDWSSMTSETRAAFISAREGIQREMASLTGRAAHSEVHAAYVASEEDGDDAMARMAVDGMVKRALGKTGGSASTPGR